MSAESKVINLIQERDELERKIKELGIFLDNAGVGRTGGLVDKDGFPRGDIDIPVIRSKRNELNCTDEAQPDACVMIICNFKGLLNDHMDIMKRIEKLLPDVFALGFAGASEASKAKPLAQVGSVQPGSLSQRAVFYSPQMGIA